jgi:hypothetical protein
MYIKVYDAGKCIAQYDVPGDWLIISSLNKVSFHRPGPEHHSEQSALVVYNNATIIVDNWEDPTGPQVNRIKE